MQIFLDVFVSQNVNAIVNVNISFQLSNSAADLQAPVGSVQDFHAF